MVLDPRAGRVQEPGTNMRRSSAASIAPAIEDKSLCKSDSFKPSRAFVYKANLALQISADEKPAPRSLCWLLQDATLTWMTAQETIATVVCSDAVPDETDFLGERFFLTTSKGESWTCYTKSTLERDAWMVALQSVLHKDDSVITSPQASEADRRACADAIDALLSSWTSILDDMRTDVYGMWKETRHWRRFGAAEREPYIQLEARVNAGDVDALSLVLGLFVYAKNPMLFVAMLAQLAVLVELRPADVVLFWPQILHWGFTHWSTCQSVNMQLFYLEFLAAVTRRRLPLAIKTAWDCVAAKADAAKDPSTYAAITLMQVYASQMSVSPDDVTADMADACFGIGATAAHQRQLQTVFSAAAALRGHPHTSVFGRWLAATSKPDRAAAALAIADACPAGAFLDPLPTAAPPPPPSPTAAMGLRGQLLMGDDDAAEMMALLLGEMDNQMDEREAPPVVVVQATFHLMHSLVVASQNFKTQIEDPRDRKKQLPTVLRRLQDTLAPHALLLMDKSAYKVEDVLVDEGTVFSTKARAPTMVWFEAYADQVETRPEPVAPLHASVYLAEVVLGDVLDSDGIPPPPPPPGSSRESMAMSESHLSLLDSSIKYSNHRLSFVNATESFDDKKARIRFSREANHGPLQPGWDVVPVIAKSFDDMRQEVFVMQLMHVCGRIFRAEGLSEIDHLWLRPYAIMCCGQDCGLMEVLTDSMSLSDAKKHYMSLSGGNVPSTLDIFAQRYGDPSSSAYVTARKNFIRSMAAYSLFCYVLQIKDRHNGNLMLHADGYVMHIDFGFCFGIAPGGAFSIERAPFKLTDDMVAVMGAQGLVAFQALVADGLVALHRHATRLLALVRVTATRSPYPCFQGDTGVFACRRMKERLCVGVLDEDVVRQHAIALVTRSAGSTTTKLYVHRSRRRC
ncbi:Aste57867_17129 [Aphanomyces stellatus]|uniref:Aste57867_17129 protein n=1 Tax=Aphanomyces stellatus TaxID=120398 RepID=A0A485L7Z5_9STRA|nr:hypothetical protein As57867_017070 [Aphanomyces stellatus]VFT93887.1 Aste57867_17129 [Aphanomyces stellatus]